LELNEFKTQNSDYDYLIKMFEYIK